MSRLLPLTAVAATLALLPASATAAPTAALRGDANRDGTVDVTGTSDVADQTTGTVDAGVLVLPNVDDDAQRCGAELTRLTAARFTVAQAAACRDGADEVVNGAEDACDLAPLHVVAWPDAPDDAQGTVAVTGPGAATAHLFRRRDGAWEPAGPLTAADLRGGVALGLEATDVVRDATRWDGRIDVRLDVTAGGATASDTVVARVAPVLLVPQTADPTAVFARAPETEAEIRAARAADRRHVRKTAAFLRTAKRSDVPPFLRQYIGHVDRYLAEQRRGVARRTALLRGFRAFDGRLRRALGRVGLGTRLTTSPDAGLFVQDDFEAGYASVPAPGGAQTMRVALLEKSSFAGVPLDPRSVPAAGVSWALRTLRGPDAGVVAGGAPSQLWEANGNLEAVPPTPGAPRGRLLLGTSSAEFAGLLAAQGAQPLLRVDTSWLAVGHVDELFGVVPADTPRGWALIAGDPAQALRILRSVPKGERSGVRVRATAQQVDAKLRPRPVPTVAGLLSGPVAGQTERAADRIEEQLAILQRELGLTDDEIVRVPVLFGTPLDSRKLTAWTGNVVNGFAPGGRRYLAVAPHGPVRRGRDLFAAAAERAFRSRGVAVTWVDTWPAPHSQLGELHCYTNALRDLAGGAWWR
jgi:protein-arginine deiminase